MCKDEITFVRFDNPFDETQGSVLVRVDKIIGITPSRYNQYLIHISNEEYPYRIASQMLKTMHLVKLTVNGANEDRDVIRVQDSSPEEVLTGLKAAILEDSVTTT